MSEQSFDKFIEDILRREEEQRERQKEYADHANTPQRRYNELYRERWQNRIRWNPRSK